MTRADSVLRQAIDWHLRLAEADTDLWHAFAEWLEADPAHRDAYERVAIDDRLLDDRPLDRAPIAIPGPPPVPPRRRAPIWAWGSGIAAMIVGAIGLHAYLGPEASAPYVVEAPATASRELALADGTRIVLNAGARLRLDRDRPRIAMLERGEALFEVHHDGSDPFRVEAAGRTIEDIGTVFDVAARGTALRIAVAEGSVAFRSGDNHIVLKPGMVVSATADDRVELRQVDPATIGGWRSGHVDFDDLRLTDIAEQLRLSNGLDIAIAPSLAQQRFSGVLRSDRGNDDMVRSLALLSGTRAVPRAGGWVLESAAAR